MLKVRPEQLKAFEQAAFTAFEDEMVEHGKRFAPEQCKAIGDQQVRLAIRHMIARSDEFGFTLRGPIRLCVELMFLCGSRFDTDPQYPGIGEILSSADGEMSKADRIHVAQLEYQEAVAGPDNINVRHAEQAILDYARQATTATDQNLETELLNEMTRAFPQRTAYIGLPALRALITEGRLEARNFGLTTPRGQILIILLMSAFGHGCTNDLLQPWIHQTLTDPLIVDSTARAARLERKSLTWLEHVLALKPPA